VVGETEGVTRKEEIRVQRAVELASSYDQYYVMPSARIGIESEILRISESEGAKSTITELL